MADTQPNSMNIPQDGSSIGLIQQAVMNPPPPPDGKQLTGPTPVPDKQELINYVIGHLDRMRNFRRQFDSKRIEFYRQYVGQRDQQKYPDNVTNRSNTFVMYPFSNVETIVSRTDDALFSFMPWFECKGRGMNDEPSAEAMGRVLDAKLTISGFKATFESLVRNIAIYGHGALKVDWDFSCDHVVTSEPIIAQQMTPMGPQPIMNPMTGQPIVLGYRPVEVDVPRNRPVFTAIDIFDLLVDPDGGVVAHLTERTFGQLRREFQGNPNSFFPESVQEISSRLLAEKDPDNVIIRMAEFWDETAGTRTLITYAQDSEVIALKDQRFAVRNAGGYSSFRRRVYGGPGILLFHGENPYLHKKAPILYTSYVKLPNEPYGLGAIEVISNLTESLNRFVNMITDNWNLGINRRYAYDTTADIDHEALNNANVPGGKVGVVGDPNKVLFPLPTHTPEPGDYAILDVYKGMIEMSSGISDFYGKGVGAPTGNRTATGISQIISESNYRFKMFIRNLELDILQPCLRMCAAMVQQYVTDQEEVLITDAPAGVPKYFAVKPEQLMGSFDFVLSASNYAENKVVRQRNLLAFANLAAQSPYLNQYNSLIELGKVFEVRNIRNLLKTEQQVAQEQQAAQQQQMQMMIFETMLQTESKARLSQAKPQPVGQGKGGGRPRTTHPEGKLPGAGLTSSIRDFAQAHGLNAMGLEGVNTP